MSYDLFKKNLIKFKPYEIRAGELIEEMKKVKIIHFSDNNEYDFKTNDGLKYEVKAEPMSLKTNNYFIEYMGYGKPSGVAVSLAEFYIITNTINYYIIGLKELKELIKKYGIKRNTKDGLTFGFIIRCCYIHDNALLLGSHDKILSSTNEI